MSVVPDSSASDEKQPYEETIQFVVTITSFVLLSIGIIFVLSRRKIFPLSARSSLTLAGVTLSNWLFVIICFIQTFPTNCHVTYYLMFAIHDIFGVVVLTEAFRIWVLQGATLARQAQALRAQIGFNDLQGSGATLSHDTSAGSGNVSTDDMVSGSAQSTQSVVASVFFQKMQRFFRTETKRLIACFVLVPILLGIQIGATYTITSADELCSVYFVLTIMVFTNLFFMAIAGFFIIQFFRQRVALDGLGVRLDLIKLVIVWAIAMGLWGGFKIALWQDSEFTEHRYLNAQIVFSATMAVSYWVTNGVTALATFSKRNNVTVPRGAFDSSTMSDDDEDDESSRTYDGQMERFGDHTSSKSSRKRRRRRQKKGLIGSLTTHHRELVEFAAGEYALENILFLDAVDKFNLTCFGLQEPQKKNVAQNRATRSTSSRREQATTMELSKLNSEMKSATNSEEEKIFVDIVPPIIGELLARKLFREFIEINSVNQINIEHRFIVEIQQSLKKLRQDRDPKLQSEARHFEELINNAPDFFSAIRTIRARRKSSRMKALRAIDDPIEFPPRLFDHSVDSVMSMVRYGILPRFLSQLDQDVGSTKS